jgi:hypothetical protein
MLPKFEISSHPQLDEVGEEIDLDRLRMVVDLISKVILQAVEHRRVYKLQPFDPSQAFREQRDGAIRFGREALDAFAIPWTLIVAAEDHFASLRLVLQRSSIFSPRVLSRAIAEAAARAWWHLDPSIDVEERVRRSFNEQFNSARELIRLEKEQNHDLQARERLESLAKNAEMVGFTVWWSKNGLPERIGDGRPGPGELMDDLLSEHVEGVGLLMWRTLSATAHGTTYAMLSAFEEGEHPFDPEKHGATTRATTKDIDLTVVIALATYLPAFTRMVQLYGWDAEPWKSFQQKVWARWLKKGD